MIWLRVFTTSQSIVARAGRFGLVGVANGLVYAGVTALFVHGLAVAPVPASIAGYCSSVPFGFVGHRRFSFRSHGHWTNEATRFGATQAMNIAVTAITMHASTVWLGRSYVLGMVAAVVLVPFSNFACLHLWVFRIRARAPRTLSS